MYSPPRPPDHSPDPQRHPVRPSPPASPSLSQRRLPSPDRRRALPAPPQAIPARPLKRSRDSPGCCRECQRYRRALGDVRQRDGAGVRTRSTGRTDRATRSAGLALAAAALVGLPGASAGPLPNPQQGDVVLPAFPSPSPPAPVAAFERHAAPAEPTPAPRQRPTKRSRVPPRYTWSDGQWVEDHGWTLLGKGGSDIARHAVTAESTGEAGEISVGEAYRTFATAMEEHVPATSSSSPSSSIKPTPTSSSTKEHTYDPAELAAQPSDSPSSTSSSSPSSSSSAASVSIPDGWRAQPRETDYYAVPIIIAMSVLVAVIVVSSIVASVFMRRKKRRRQRRRSARKGEKVDEGGWRGVVEKVMDPVRSVGRKKGKKRDEDGKGGGPGGMEDEGGAAGAGAGEGGSGGSASGGHRRVRTTGFAAGNRVRPRRRRRREGGDDEDDEGTALTRTGTRSSTSSVAHDTLTARLSARLRGERGDEARRGGAGATTVFSRDAGSASLVSLTASALSRVPSSGSRRSSLRNAGTAPAQPPDLLFTPADDPSLPDHLPIPGSDSASLRRDRSALSVSSLAGAAEQTPLTPPPTSSFGMLIASDTLPAPGPPAYRPSSSTVQSTRRYGAGDIVSPSPDRGSGAASLAAAGDEAARHGRSRRLFGARRDAREERPVEEDEGEWHWPGEKGRPLATEVAGPSGAGSSGTRARPASLVSAPPSVADGADEDEDEREPPVDRSLFSAHVATDDKATLARLREQRDRTIGDGGDDVAPSADPSVPAPTAPDFDDEEDLDEDGFERFDPDAPSSSAAAPSAPAPSSLLPAPPRPVVQHTSTFSYPRMPAGATPQMSRSTSTLASSTAPLLTPTLATSTAQPQDKAALAAAEYAERDEDDALPLYLAGSGQRGVAAREALGMASAPPAALEDDEDDDEEGGFGEVTRNEGEREREGVV